MSYCRFSAGYPGVEPCDVYVFFHVDGYLQCHACRLTAVDYDSRGNYDTESPGAMIAHLHRHKSAGHAVPEHAFAELAKDSEHSPEGADHG